jgi:hypothetical protein
MKGTATGFLSSGVLLVVLLTVLLLGSCGRPAAGQSFLWATVPAPAPAEPQNVYDGVQRIVDCEAGVVIYTLKDVYPGIGPVGGVSALPLAETTLGDVCK